MTAAARVMLLVEVALIVFLIGRARAQGSVPRRRGMYLLAWTVLPSLALLAGWSLIAPAFVTQAVLATPPAAGLPPAPFERAAILAQARAGIGGWHPLAAALAPAFARAQAWSDWLATTVMLGTAMLGFVVGRWRLRNGVEPHGATERLAIRLLALAALVVVLTTVGIVASLLWESIRFFEQVPPLAFLFGTRWAPQALDGVGDAAVLGALPLFWGSFLIGVVIAMAVAVPLGLLSAIWLSHYARPGTRRLVKPVLEVLAGIPTVIYGWWAVLTVAPAIRRLGLALGSDGASGESALAAGLVMGVLAIPYVSSAADDAFAALPVELRDGSLALGATTAETVLRILLPAALPGIAGGVLLAVGRTVGETMIAVMVASAAAVVSLDPFRPATTVTRQIVDLLTGEATFDSPKTLAAFALGLTLFAVTLLLNFFARRFVHRFTAAHG